MFAIGTKRDIPIAPAFVRYWSNSVMTLATFGVARPHIL